jgi:transketolase
MRNSFSEALYVEALSDSRICVVVADISPAGSMSKFAIDFPDRFINVGVAEQSMIGICAGLALRGFKPFAYTIATFSLYRPFEMVRNDLAYQNLPVTVVGMGSGVTYAPLGGTHHSQEDIAIATAIPNMKVIAPCDPLEVRDATKYCASNEKGPIYLRIGKSGEPNLTLEGDQWIFGKIRYLFRGDGDCCILTYGAIAKIAFQVKDKIVENNDKQIPSIICVHTLKPLDISGLDSVLRKYKTIIVLEETSIYGSLSNQLKVIAYDKNITTQIKAFTLSDQFIDNNGSWENLLTAHGITVDNICKHIESK